MPRMPPSLSSASAQVMPVFRREQATGKGIRRHADVDALREIDHYLTSQSAWRLCRAPSRWSTGRHVDHGRHRQLPGQPPHEQIAADAMVPPRRRSPAPGPLRCPQRQARIRLRTAVRCRSRSHYRYGQGCLTPNFRRSPRRRDGNGSPRSQGGRVAANARSGRWSASPSRSLRMVATGCGDPLPRVSECRDVRSPVRVPCERNPLGQPGGRSTGRSAPELAPLPIETAAHPPRAG